MKNILFLIAAALLTGCVTPPQKPIEMDQNFLQKGSKKVGVMLTQMPIPDVYLPGANCLLCLAAAEVAVSDLSTHVETLAPDDFKLVESELVKQLKAKGVDVIAINEVLDTESLPEFSSEVEGFARLDYRGFGSKYKISHLLVIDVNAIGMIRNYASYIPVDDPRALVKGVSYLVDLKNNRYKWYKHIKVNKSAKGEWDEPPNFPALTNAYYQAIEMGREMVLSEF